jgi:DMSO/TMAO reductase YedYZ molybdopterin-dependent catalytic subunit
MPPITRGFRRRRPEAADAKLPPGQYLETGFPVLSAGPTPRVDHAQWEFTVDGAVGEQRRWNWETFRALPSETFTTDIHCVTSWSKFGTVWEGVRVDTLLEGTAPAGDFLVADCYGGYTTNLALADVLDGKAWVVFAYDGAPLRPEHGGPARLLVPHLYFWKSAKWVRGLRITEGNEPGFWEQLGYHDRGDPWLEQRYQGD